ncbi:MAG: methenyltetrahydromethanopterin cyclohydrolase [Planctomycetaceae bacterium]
MLNHASFHLIRSLAEQSDALRVRANNIAEATVVDAGIDVPGSLAAGVIVAEVCLGGLADVSLAPADADRFASEVAVMVRTDAPLQACLGGQYAGWPVSAGKYFAMGSGPMRMVRGREEMLLELDLRESSDVVAGVLESTELPTAEAIQLIASDTRTTPENLALVVAPSGSLVGSIQVVARSVETAMHKLHALGFDVRTIFSAVGVAPVPPPAKPSDVVGGIGRTNDAILYGGRVTLWVDCEQSQVDDIAPAVPSSASKDYGRPFAAIFKDCGYDFYKVDPHLFCPAVVTIVNRRSGVARCFGTVNTDVLRQSFFA